MRTTILMILLMAFISGIFPEKAAAQDDGFKIVLRDVFYGALVGALVGGALLAFREDPKDDLDLIIRGAAIGVFAGVAFGLYQATQSVAELEGGIVTVGLPTPLITVDSGPLNLNSIGMGASLFTWRY